MYHRYRSHAPRKTPGSVPEMKMVKSPHRKRKVTFNDSIKIHFMYVYSYASREARNGYCYIEASADRLRFKKKIVEVGNVLTPVLLKRMNCKLNQ